MNRFFQPAGLLAAALAVAACGPIPQAAAGEASTAALYRKMCARCHGDDGRGVTTRSRAEAPDLSSEMWQDSRTDGQILASLLNGLGTDMPAFDDRLSHAQANDLVAFMRGFGPARHGNGAGDSFETRFRQLEREFESLARQVRALDRKP